jgi:hypothetical protein
LIPFLTRIERLTRLFGYGPSVLVFQTIAKGLRAGREDLRRAQTPIRWCVCSLAIV